MPKSLSGTEQPRRPRRRTNASSKRAPAANPGAPPEAGDSPIAAEATPSDVATISQPIEPATATTEIVRELPARPRPRAFVSVSSIRAGTRWLAGLYDTIFH